MLCSQAFTQGEGLGLLGEDKVLGLDSQKLSSDGTKWGVVTCPALPLRASRNPETLPSGKTRDCL